MREYEAALTLYRTHLSAAASMPPVERLVRDLPPFRVTPARVVGEVYVVTQDGQRIDGRALAGMSIDSGALIVTGPGSSVQLTLPDGTAFSTGANSRMTLDTFVYNPNAGVRRILASLTRGSMRWVTGQGLRFSQDDLRVILGNAILGIRGTDFELEVREDGSGSLRLHEGEVVITPNNGGAPVTLVPGQMVTFDAAGVITGPSPM